MDRDLHARRRRLLRTRWPDLARAVGAFALSGVLVVVLVRHWPFLVGLAVGTYFGALTVLLLVLLPIADGSLLPRLGRALEADVGKELLKAPGVFTVISGISFAQRDVDHVVLARGGCFAVEVKATFGRRTSLNGVPDLKGKLAQARDGARQIQLLLDSRGVSLPVRPMLILAGPGAPDLTGIERHDDVLIAPLRNSDAWQPQFTDPDGSLEEGTTRAAAAELLAYRSQRIDYELSDRH